MDVEVVTHDRRDGHGDGTGWVVRAGPSDLAHRHGDHSTGRGHAAMTSLPVASRKAAATPIPRQTSRISCA